MRRPSWRSGRRPSYGAAGMPDVIVPADPRAALAGPLDPSLLEIRSGPTAQRRGLWLRRIVRRAWVAVAAVILAELVLWTVARCQCSTV